MKPVYLIVNADDFGYFDGVSRGIVDAAKRGIVTATGILATTGDLEKHVRLLEEVPELDTGVHLNLTHGEAVSDSMRARLGRWNGRFPAKAALLAAFVRRSIDLQAVASEWRAQIERCLRLGLPVHFLNSHEHVHMLPPLYRIAAALAEEFDIAHLRRTCTEWRAGCSAGSVVRNLLLGMAGAVPAPYRAGRAPRMVGLAASGKLSAEYLRRRLRTLHRGGIYELMCHPGTPDPNEEIDRRIRRYHHWESEHALLCSSATRDALMAFGIRLIGFRDLRLKDRHIEILEPSVRT